MKREEIKDALERAKIQIRNIQYAGQQCLCYCIHTELMKCKSYDRFLDFEYRFRCDLIKSIIPEFYPEFFSTTPIPPTSRIFKHEEGKYWFWWPKGDIESRVAALDKLIELYS